MEILILGGTGAMGVPLVKKLSIDKNNAVYVTTRKIRTSADDNVHYVSGNAHDLSFIKKLCAEKHYEVIVDFMIYSEKEFTERVEYFLANSDQYIFLSSCRVYADCKGRITEDSSRLLDIVKDPDYLATNEYALCKAREEDLLQNSEKNNWTIIRPYITYNSNRLQLGTLEKEYWLNRAIHHKSIVLTKRTSESLTSLTYGEDVSNAIASVIGKNYCYGQTFQIVNEESMTWKQILQIYLNAFEEVKGFKPDVKLLDDWQGLANVLGNQYQMKYDRFLNRQFDSSKIEEYTGEKIQYKETKTGLKECLTQFLTEEDVTGQMPTNWSYEGYADRVTREHSRMADINGIKNKLKYIWWRYIPLKIAMLKKHR